MKKYRFKLEKLLKIREHREKEAKIAYARELQKKVSMENQNKELSDLAHRTALDNFESAQAGQIIDFNSLHNQQQFERGVGARIARNKQETAAMAEGLNELRLKLTEAVKEKKKLEKLEEKEFNAFKRERKAAEIKDLDDAKYEMDK